MIIEGVIYLERSQNFPKNKHFLPLCVSVGEKYYFFWQVLCTYIIDYSELSFADIHLQSNLKVTFINFYQ